MALRGPGEVSALKTDPIRTLRCRAERLLLVCATAGLMLLTGGALHAPSAQVPPASVLADTTRGTIHVVKKGDTLWDLSSAYMKSPWVWPILYRANDSTIVDPHWIYPGQRIWIPVGGGPPIVLSFEEVWPGQVTAADQAAQQAQTVPTTTTPPASTSPETPPSGTMSSSGVRVSGFRAAAEAHYPLATASVIYEAGYIDEPADWPLGKIIDGENADMNMSLYNRVFIDVGEARARVGDLFAVVEAGAKIKHPEWGNYLGRKVVVKGVIRIEQVEASSSEGVLVAVFDSVRRKDRVIQAPAVDVRPWQEFIPVQGGRESVVVARANDDGNLHPYDMLFIDGGTGQDVKVGDLYQVLRPETERGRLRFYQEELARGVVISVQKETATLMILNVSFSGIQAGERIRLMGRSVFVPEGSGGS